MADSFSPLSMCSLSTNCWGVNLKEITYTCAAQLECSQQYACSESQMKRGWDC